MKSKYGYYKVSTANFKISVANVNKNYLEISSLIKKASQNNVNVLVFQELCLTGYTCNDLFFNKDLYLETEKAISKLIEIIPSNMIVFVGGPFYYLDKIFNVSYVLIKNKVIGITCKTYLPNYKEFYEKRWFTSANNISFNQVEFLNDIVPFGNDLIYDFGQMKIGCEICEDMWVINSPNIYYSLNGANVIVNLSASNEVISKKEYREELVKMTSSKDYVGYIYCSSGIGESSQDLVFSGHQIIYQCGNYVNSSYDVKNDLTMGILDIEKIDNDRKIFNSSFEGEIYKTCRFIKIENDNEIELLPSKVDAYPFILKEDIKRKERSLEIIDLQAKGLANRLNNINIKNVVIGVSGGLDSTLALIVIYQAYKMLDLPFSNIHCISMPGFATSKLTFNNAKKLIKLIGGTYKQIDIKKACKQHLLDLNHPLDLYDVTYENVQARTRTQILMDYANNINGIVVGTGDLSELALGFATYNGDHMSMYGVNCSIPKTLVKLLVSDFGNQYIQFKSVLDSIINTPISPELVPSKDGQITQKTEQIIGKYDLHDFFLYNFNRYNFSKEKIYQLACIGFPNLDKEYIKSTLDIFMKRFFANQFKRSCLPDGVKVGSICLSPRGDFRMSSDLNSINSINKEEK